MFELYRTKSKKKNLKAYIDADGNVRMPCYKCIHNSKQLEEKPCNECLKMALVDEK